MITLQSSEFCAIVKAATGLTPNMMDKNYGPPDESWPIKPPSIFGFPYYEYRPDSHDCDDFSKRCDNEWRDRHYRQKGKLALPCGIVVIDRPFVDPLTRKRHAFNFMVVDVRGAPTLRFYERRQDGIFVPDIEGKFSEVYT